MTELENGGPILPETEQETEHNIESEPYVDTETDDHTNQTGILSDKKWVALAGIFAVVTVGTALAVILIRKKK